MMQDSATAGHGFPIPQSISPEAQDILAAPRMSGGLPPQSDDPAAWRRHIVSTNEGLAAFYRTITPTSGMAVRETALAGVPVHDAAPDGADASHIIFDMHGGGLVYMGGRVLVDLCARFTAARTGCRTVSPDYRMPPDHPYPAALDDCMVVYRALVERHGAENIIVSGASAGGNLAAATILRARDEGVALPAGLALLTPEVDLTESGDTFRTLSGLDIIGSFARQNRLYAGQTPLDHPYVSPLFGQFTGFPPTFLQSGTRDLFLSNTVLMHRKLRAAGINAELHVWEAMTHGGFGDTPEDRDMAAELRRFIARCFAHAQARG